MIGVIKNECSKYGQEYEQNEKYLCIREDMLDLKIRKNEWLENCKQYRYLRIVIENSGCDTTKFKKRIVQGRKMVKILKMVFGGVKRSQETKYRIYNTIVKSLLTYRKMKKKRSRIVAVQMDALRRSCGILRRDKIRNEVTKRKMKISKTVQREIKRRQLIWYGHHTCQVFRKKRICSVFQGLFTKIHFKAKMFFFLFFLTFSTLHF